MSKLEIETPHIVDQNSPSNHEYNTIINNYFRFESEKEIRLMVENEVESVESSKEMPMIQDQNIKNNFSRSMNQTFANWWYVQKESRTWITWCKW